MDQFSERLARLSELSDEEVSALESEMVDAFDTADSGGDLESMQAIADALDTVRTEQADRSSTAAPPADVPAAAEAPAQMAASSAEDDDEDGKDEGVVDGDADLSDESVTESEPEPDSEPAPAEPENESEATPEPELAEAAVSEPEVPSDGGETASDTPDAETAEGDDSTEQESEEPVATEITASEVPEEHDPDILSENAAPLYAIHAGGDIPGYTSGALLADMDAVSEAMASKINSMRSIGGDGEHIVVASIRTTAESDEGHTLMRGDAIGNARKVRALLADKEALTPEGLTAGAWCAPRAPIYEVPTIGTTRRPVRDALPTFNADRGGVVWMDPPTIPSIANSGVSLWRYGGATWGSYQTPDGSGAAATTKPCYTITCGTEHTADLDALTLCLCFDNLMARAFPEWVRSTTDLTMVAQARFAEQVALSQMFAVAATGSCGTPATQVGAARDFFLTVRAAAASRRWGNRLDQDAPLQLLAPAWVAEAMGSDLGLQQPGDDTFSTSNAEINGYFGDINVQPIWYIDDAPGTAAFTGCSYPVNAHWLLFPTGAYMRLDNGDLNLGVVRTKEDVQANRYCEFAETFETIVYMGPASPNQWVTRGLTQIDLAGSSGLPRLIPIT